MFWNGIEGKELSFFLLAVIFLLMGLLDKASFFHAGVNVIKLLVFLTDSFERCISFCVSLFKRCILLVQKFLIVIAMRAYLQDLSFHSVIVLQFLFVLGFVLRLRLVELDFL